MPSNFTAKSDGITQAGQLRRRLTIQQETRTEDGYGGYTVEWATVANVFGAEMAWKPYNYAAPGQPLQLVYTRYIIRYMPTTQVVAGMRLVDNDSTGSGGTTFTIMGAIDPDGTKRQLHLTCEQVAPGTA